MKSSATSRRALLLVILSTTVAMTTMNPSPNRVHGYQYSDNERRQLRGRTTANGRGLATATTPITTSAPSSPPSAAPSSSPSISPSTIAPTSYRSASPTELQSSSPSTSPTSPISPSVSPSAMPSYSPTGFSSASPTTSEISERPSTNPTTTSSTLEPTNNEDFVLLDVTTTSNSVSGILPWNWDAGQWNDNLKDMSEFAASQIPVMGEFISFAIGLFWPSSSQESMFSQMESQIEFLIGQAVIENNQQFLSGDIAAIQQYMQQYNQSSTNEEKSQWLNQAIAKCEATRSNVMNLSPSYTYIPWMVQLSALHLANARELFLFGTTLYNTTTQNPNWQNWLQQAYDDYNSYFNDAYPQWQSYRESYITGSSCSEGFTVKDQVSGEDITVCWESTLSYNCPGQMADKPYWSTGAYESGTINAMRNELETQMVSVMSPSWYNIKYLPWANSTGPIYPTWFPSDGQFSLGPYASWGSRVVGIDESMTVQDDPGLATGMQVNVYNSVDAMYVTYEGHNGEHVGDSGGTKTYTSFQQLTGSTQSYFQALMVNFWDGWSAPLVGSVTMYANSDDKKLLVAKSEGWDGGQGLVNMTVGTDFQLVSLGQIDGPGPSGTSGTIGVEATFMYRDYALQKFST